MALKKLQIEVSLTTSFGPKERHDWFRVVRFADNAVIFIYSYQAALIVKQAVKRFLLPRGFLINEDKLKSSIGRKHPPLPLQASQLKLYTPKVKQNLFLAFPKRNQKILYLKYTNKATILQLFQSLQQKNQKGLNCKQIKEKIKEGDKEVIKK
eukprot:TRINITY_DN50512_c0_g1_i2.p1 TRINITY_DN50512_c0_g1~~TRINITY_DN50512_c0_g1_i2.p1  ORF type:complete len:153 (-),score=7.49 TRINITY_DN50512_c0_g1_i2:9-467(-)